MGYFQFSEFFGYFKLKNGHFGHFYAQIWSLAVLFSQTTANFKNPLPISLSLMVNNIWAKIGHFDASGDEFYSFEVTAVLKISMFFIYRDFPIYWQNCDFSK